MRTMNASALLALMGCHDDEKIELSFVEVRPPKLFPQASFSSYNAQMMTMLAMQPPSP